MPRRSGSRTPCGRSLPLGPTCKWKANSSMPTNAVRAKKSRRAEPGHAPTTIASTPVCKVDGSPARMRTVVDRKVVEPARRLGLRVDPGSVPPTNQKTEGALPLGSEAAEILARRCGARMSHAVGGEMARGTPRRRGRSPLVVDDERVAVERRDLRRLRGARGGGLGIDDPLDRSKHALAHALRRTCARSV